MHNALYILNADAYERIYGPPERAEIASLVNIVKPQLTAQEAATQPEVLRDVDVIFSGWGMARLNEAFLSAAPNLKAVFYAAGSIRGFATEAAWDREIIICSGWGANAVPVVEYTLSQILFSLKHGWRHALDIKRQARWVRHGSVPGAFGSTVGLVSLGMVGRGVARRLQTFDINVLAFDPFVTQSDARELRVTLCSLDEIFQRSDVVSLHAPKIPETLGMITGAHLEAMKPGATFINTSRGAVVRESEMIEVLQRRDDLFAVLDVTNPEPPVAGSPLYGMPNVILTPHIAGSMAQECRRMAQYMIEEYIRFRESKPLRWQITRERAKTLA